MQAIPPKMYHGLRRYCLLIELCLLRCAAKVEVWKHAPLFKGLDHLNEGLGDLAGNPQKLVFLAGGIRQNDHKKHGRFTTPIVSERDSYVIYLRSQLPGSATDRSLKLR